MINNLKKLKQIIKTNQKELEDIYPYTPQILETITMLIQKRASDTMIILWRKGVLELLSNIEAGIEYIEYYQKIDRKTQLTNLKDKIDNNISKLEKKYPISSKISQELETLIIVDAPDDMIRAYLNGLENYIRDIDVELGML